MKYRESKVEEAKKEIERLQKFIDDSKKPVELWILKDSDGHCLAIKKTEKESMDWRNELIADGNDADFEDYMPTLFREVKDDEQS